MREAAILSFLRDTRRCAAAMIEDMLSFLRCVDCVSRAGPGLDVAVDGQESRDRYAAVVRLLDVELLAARPGHRDEAMRSNGLVMDA